jgi:hypothetical protein
MQTCANEPIPYLNEVCARLQQRVAAWETTSGQQYRQGPGQSLIYGSLKQEVDVVVKNVADLESYYHLLKSRPFEAGKTVDARKSIYNQTISNAPVAVLDRYSEAPDGVPEQALLADRADTSGEHEAPFAALVELPKLMTKSSFDELDYITVASFLLALFLDVFVLAVAWGVGHSSLTEGAALLPIKRTLKPEWDRDIVSVVAGWIREATLMPEASVDEQVGFVRAILARIRSEGEASELTAADPLHKRFAEALVRARVATLADQSTEGGVEGPSTYRLKPWISPALVRFMELIRRPQGAAVLA